MPCIRHDYQKSEWLSVARIITFGFEEENYFSLFLSRVCVCLYGKEMMSRCIQGELSPDDDL